MNDKQVRADLCRKINKALARNNKKNTNILLIFYLVIIGCKTEQFEDKQRSPISLNRSKRTDDDDDDESTSISKNY